MRKLSVGLFPYGDNGNPYQLLIRKALDEQGVDTLPIPKRNFLPLTRAVRSPIQVLQMYWPHSLFTGATPWRTHFKRSMLQLDIRSLGRKKFVFSAENLYPHDSRQVADDIAYTQKILHYCHGAVFTSEAARRVYLDVYKLPAGAVQAVVPHIHYVDQYPNCVDRAEARCHLGLDPAQKVILSLGRIHPYKGLNHLIGAFGRAAAPDHCLVVAGRAKSESVVAELRQRIAAAKGKGEVRIVDRFIPDEELQYFYNASDAVAITYDDMPINPGSVIMAMGFGKCIIAPDKGPIRELIHPEALFSYPDEGEEALQAALDAFGRADRLAARGACNRQRVLERHAPAVAGRKFVDLYQSIL